MTPTLTYPCIKCRKPHTASRASALAMLAVCKVCQEERFAKGVRDRAKADAERKVGA